MSSGLLAKLASEVSDSKCEFVAIKLTHCKDEADVQDFPENRYEAVLLASLEQPIDISDDEQLSQVCDQSEFQKNIY